MQGNQHLGAHERGDLGNDVLRRPPGNGLRGPESLGQNLLVRILVDGDDSCLGVQRSQDGHGQQPQGAAAADDDRIARPRRKIEDRVERDAEWVGQHGLFITDAVRYGKAHGLVGGHQGSKASGGRTRSSRMNAARTEPLMKVVAAGKIALRAGGTRFRKPLVVAGKPGIQHHPLAPPAVFHGRADLFDGPHHFMAQDLGKADQGGHRIVPIADGKDLLVIAAADPAIPRLDEDPIVGGQPGVGDLPVLKRSEPARVSRWGDVPQQFRQDYP